MAGVRLFEDLEVWRNARALNSEVYMASRVGAFSKDFVLCGQIRRAAISVMSNIAEGFERGGDKEFVQFLSLAKGSCGEIRSQLYAALDQAYISQQDFESLKGRAVEVSRMISGLMKYLQKSPLRGSKYKCSS